MKTGLFFRNMVKSIFSRRDENVKNRHLARRIRHAVVSYTATLNLIASLGAWTKSCLVPRYRSVVWTEAWPNSI